MVSPALPLISPSSINWVINPPRALSTAPVAPAGFLTPRKRFTTKARVSILVMSADWTSISRPLTLEPLVDLLALAARGLVVVIKVIYLLLV